MSQDKSAGSEKKRTWNMQKPVVEAVSVQKKWTMADSKRSVSKK